MTRSLRSRLIIAICTTLTVFLGTVGIVLEKAFVESVERGVANSQESRIYALLAQINDEEPGDLLLPDLLPDDSFNQISSGVYGLLLDSEAKVIWQSASLTSETWSQPLSKLPGKMFFYTPDLESFYATSFVAIWEEDQEEFRYTLLVFEDKNRYTETIAIFRVNLWGWFFATILLLLVILIGLMRWGFSPLKEVTQAIQDIEGGVKDKITGQFPIEISRLTDNINMLLESERNQRQRYRDSLADLAHSLKTPLAVIRSLTDRQQTDADYLMLNLNEQVDRMDQIVSHQLHRAINASKAAFLKPLAVQPIVEKVCFALGKVYRDKHVQFITLCEPDVKVVADEADFMEVLGNLLENAAKYGRSTVRCEVRVREPESGVDIAKITLFVEDDGPGIPESKRQSVLRRGRRIDEGKEGQGIGLAVASDIIDTYGGQIRIETSHLGGAKFIVLL